MFVLSRHGKWLLVYGLGGNFNVLEDKGTKLGRETGRQCFLSSAGAGWLSNGTSLSASRGRVYLPTKDTAQLTRDGGTFKSLINVTFFCIKKKKPNNQATQQKANQTDIPIGILKLDGQPQV